MLTLRPVTTASQIWRLLILSSSRPVSPPSFPTFFLTEFGPPASLPKVPAHHPLVSTCLFYSYRASAFRFGSSSSRPSPSHTPSPPEAPTSTSFQYTPKISSRGLSTASSATHATMSSDSDDDMPLSRFNGRSRGKCARHPQLCASFLCSPSGRGFG